MDKLGMQIRIARHDNNEVADNEMKIYREILKKIMRNNTWGIVRKQGMRRDVVHKKEVMSYNIERGPQFIGLPQKQERT